MKKIFLLLVSIFLTTNLLAHSTKNINFDSNANCSKKRSMLNGIAKLKNYKDGEIIKFSSYTGFDQRTVLINGHKKNPIEITSLLFLPKGSNKFQLLFGHTAVEGQVFTYGMILHITDLKTF